MKELRQRGIECDDATKAKSIVNSINNPMKNPEIVAKKAATQMGALNHAYKGDRWTHAEVTQLRELCKAQHTKKRRLQK